MDFAFFVIGLVLLIAGADLLVRSSSELAGRLGIPPVIIGLTVVAYGTSAPEIAFTYQSAWMGEADLAVANVVGSNIVNHYLILGLAALVLPLSVHRKLIEVDIPLVIGLGVGFLLASLDGSIGVGEGGLLFVGWFLYTAMSIYYARKQPDVVKKEFRGFRKKAMDIETLQRFGTIMLVTGVLLGIALLVLGSRWFSSGAVSIARLLGVSEWVIGATIVAAGTSFPELVTSLLAAFNGRDDVAVANVIGSSLFNILGGLGGASVISGAAIPISSGVVIFDLPVMVIGFLVCLPFALSEFELARWEGAVLLVYFVVYTILLFDGWLPEWLDTFEGTLVVLSPILVTIVVELTRSALGTRN